MSKKTLLEKVRAIKAPEELEELIGKDFEIVDISHRGGTLGFYASTIAELVDISEDLLPNKFGAYSNYLGGGLRGAIVASDFSKEVPAQKAKLLVALGDAIVRCYNYYETEEGLQDEEYPDGERNWDNFGTNRSRQAGIVSAY